MTRKPSKWIYRYYVINATGKYEPYIGHFYENNRNQGDEYVWTFANWDTLEKTGTLHGIFMNKYLRDSQKDSDETHDKAKRMIDAIVFAHKKAEKNDAKEGK